MTVLRVQVETERPGIVEVRAKAAPGREMDAKPIGGFFVRRRYAGDRFMIAKWEEFSPTWMEFVEPDKVPKDWIEKIEARAAQRNQQWLAAGPENAISEVQRAQFSMASLQRPEDAGVINQATGKVTKTLSLKGQQAGA